MKIRQEIWSPKVGWSTIYEKGNLHQANIVFCQGNMDTHNSGSLYREIKHAFPDSVILFSLSKKSISSNLFLTALFFEHIPFSIFQYNPKNALIEARRNHHSSLCSSKKITQLLLCSSLASQEEEKIATQLQSNFSLKSIEKAKDKSLSFLGINQLPKSPTAIYIHPSIPI